MREFVEVDLGREAAPDETAVCKFCHLLKRHELGKKGNQWYFGMKVHLGVDSKTKLIHSVVAAPASRNDKHCLPELTHTQHIVKRDSFTCYSEV